MCSDTKETYVQLMVQAPLKSHEFSGDVVARNNVSATLCSGTPSCGRRSRTQELHESQMASGRQRPGPGLVESVGEVEEEVEAVRSAEEVGGRWLGALKGWWPCPDAAMPAETPLNSESGGPAWWCWSRVQVGVEEEAEEG